MTTRYRLWYLKMGCEFSCFLFVISLHSTLCNPKMYWKLDSLEGRVISSAKFNPEQLTRDEETIMFEILKSTKFRHGHLWAKSGDSCVECQRQRWDDSDDLEYRNSSEYDGDSNSNKKSLAIKKKSKILNCGKPVDFTVYDHLKGMENRKNHPPLSGSEQNRDKVDLDAMEERLKVAREEKPVPLSIYTEIGDYWRMRGDVNKAIGCFRRVLSESRTDSQALISLAKVLYSVNHIENAAYLLRKSLETAPVDEVRSLCRPNDEDCGGLYTNRVFRRWFKYFTLGEILHIQETMLKLQRVVELNNGYLPAVIRLDQLETFLDTLGNSSREYANSFPNGMHIYTMCIIGLLVLGVLLGIASSCDKETEKNKESGRFRRGLKSFRFRGFHGTRGKPLWHREE